MLLTEIVSIKINNSNRKYYKNVKNGDIIDVNISNLNEGSHTKVKVKCDTCGKEKIIEYRWYILSLKNSNYYACSPKCASNKNKNTCLEKYGVENIFQLNVAKNKYKETCLEKYGVEYYLQSENCKIKTKKTSLEKYNVDSINKSEIVKEHKKISMINKYNVENPSQLKEVKNKKIQTSLINYNVESPLQSEIIKNKIKETCLKKYGVKHYNKSENYKYKYKQKYINKFGISPEDRNFQIKIYRNIVKRLTEKNKKELFNNWNGYDYYDKEYIKDNLNLNSLNKNYPSIDHKISVNYGFINNIRPEIIADINNLCITKRSINSRKGEKCYEK